MNKKTLAIILACLMMLLPAFASCADKTGGGNTHAVASEPGP